jgi:hypothetical protein
MRAATQGAESEKCRTTAVGKEGVGWETREQAQLMTARADGGERCAPRVRKTMISSAHNV